MSTAACELLGIERPIVQVPMAAVPRLAAAVSNAGALGMVTLTWSADTGAVAQGWEAGGHVWGTVATLPLVPAVVDAVAPGTAR
jgi:NAD(P)H-dependent flavin oxidoreductase YrpB (nitropropane dioxygenase family)